jgi:2'-5' RNA ligase
LDRVEHWKKQQLLCACLAQHSGAAASPDVAGPTALTALAEVLETELARAGFAPDLKSSGLVGPDPTRQFRPHVTLARKVLRAPRMLQMRPVIWTFADFVLVGSNTLPEGSVYTVLERFPLCR